MLQKDLKKTIIFVSHDLDEALKIGNRIAILEGGRIVQCGTAEDILLRPANDYVAEFVKHMNPLNVLRGGALMTPAASLKRDGDDVISTARPHPRRSSTPEGKPVSCTLDGARRARSRPPTARSAAPGGADPTSSSRRSI